MTSYYELSLALQTHLDAIPKDGADKRVVALGALRTINERFDSSRMRAAHASSAYFIDDQLTTDSFLMPTQKFGEIILKGNVPRVACTRILGRFTIALPFFNSIILGPSQEIEPELVAYELDDYDSVLPIDTPIRRPIYTPVESILFMTDIA